MTHTPTVATDRLDGWRLVERSEDTPFDVRFLRVVSHTAVYEDAALRETLSERAGLDGQWRFFLTSRLRLLPSPPGSAALSRLVAGRATDAFERRLQERGFERVARADARPFRRGDGTEARLTRFAARCPVAGLDLDVEAWLAVWDGDADGEFLVAGGAYPRRVVSSESTVAAEVESQFDPGRFKRELFDLVRAVE
ncbi:hypothetical protein ACFO0N_00405 [Halobium salinum]|uniref:Uncharacterized protein n=1 Tax=Halobium salinum TaxID=1364940 RepID=A0ABD5P7D4_9EURY|nr:hypothetical protein [Halobium salinum]